MILYMRERCLKLVLDDLREVEYEWKQHDHKAKMLCRESHNKDTSKWFLSSMADLRPFFTSAPDNLSFPMQN